ncbi:MAG: glycosyltransferase family 2 protein [Candidatus Micrarchaeota archaeon]|nr:glycosyltransferase family 2 protein [Candidatus Micrarchaeota archaeon]
MAAPNEYARSTLKLQERKDLAVFGLIGIAAIIFIFLTISYQIVFMLYAIASIFIFCTYFMLWNEKEGEEHFADTGKYPHITVLIPSFNTRHTIFECIRTCKGSVYPGKLDILVIDDGSTDGSYELLQKVEGIELHRQVKNGGKAAALNYGIEKAKGEIVACVDSDTYLAKNTLKQAVKHFAEGENVASVVVFICVNNPRNLLQRIQELEYWVSFGFFFKTIATVNGLYVTPGPTALYRKDILQKLGGYDEKNLCEDLEIALRLQKHGYRISACHQTIVKTEVPDNLKQLYKQRLRWYRGGAANIIRYSELFFNKKYGDLGFFVLPTMLGSGLVAALFMAWTILFTAKNALSWLLPFTYDFSAGMTLTAISVGNGFFMLNSGWILWVFAICIWGYFLVKSFEMVGEHFQLKHVLPLLCLLWIYPLFLGFVFMVSYAYELFGVKYTW